MTEACTDTQLSSSPTPSPSSSQHISFAHRGSVDAASTKSMRMRSRTSSSSRYERVSASREEDGAFLDTIVRFLKAELPSSRLMRRASTCETGRSPASGADNRLPDLQQRHHRRASCDVFSTIIRTTAESQARIGLPCLARSSVYNNSVSTRSKPA